MEIFEQITQIVQSEEVQPFPSYIHLPGMSNDASLFIMGLVLYARALHEVYTETKLKLDEVVAAQIGSLDPDRS